MWCPSCAELIKLILLKETGIRSCHVDYTTDLATIEYAPRRLSKDTILERIRSLGYRPFSLEAAEKKEINFRLTLRFIIAAFCTLNVMMFAYPVYASYFDSDDMEYAALFGWLSFFTSLPVLLYCAWPIWNRFFHALKVKRIGMEALVIIGISATFLLSTYELLFGHQRIYFDSMCVVVTFVLLGKIFGKQSEILS